MNKLEIILSISIVFVLLLIFVKLVSEHQSQSMILMINLTYLKTLDMLKIQVLQPNQNISESIKKTLAIESCITEAID